MWPVIVITTDSLMILWKKKCDLQGTIEIHVKRCDSVRDACSVHSLWLIACVLMHVLLKMGESCSKGIWRDLGPL